MRTDSPTALTTVLIRASELRRASTWKPRGYMADVMSVATDAGDGMLRIQREDYAALQAKYRGLGDKVHEALLPYVRKFDRRFGTNLEGCSGCARRRRWLNALTSGR